jgi:hypothetical protein
MSDPEDRESGPKPPPSEKAPEPYIPSRLREKMEESTGDDDFDIPERSPVGLIIGIAVVVVIAAVAFWFFHSQQVKAKAEAAARAAREKATADSIAAVHRADSLLAVHRADSIAAFQKLPRAKQHEILVAQARAKADLERSEGPYAIDAGEFLFQDKAQEQADALKSSTHLPAQVVKRGASYHVYLGKFEMRSAANKAVTDLTGKGLLQEANVVSVKGS